MAGRKRREKNEKSWLPALWNAGMAAGILAFLGWLVWSQREASGPSREPPAASAVHPAEPVAWPWRLMPLGESVPPSPAPVPRLLPRPSTPPMSTTSPGPVGERPGAVLEAQIALANLALSPGSIDGVLGSQTRGAIRAFQRKAGLAETGELDEATRQALRPVEEAIESFVVTQEDLAQLGEVPAGWQAKSEAVTLPYESVLELVAERTWSHPKLVRSLNPQVVWSNVPAGTVLQVPRVRFPPAQVKARWIVIILGARELQAYDQRTNLLAHFPCSIARRIEKRPVGELVVETVALRPNYRFNPDIFTESPEARRIGRPLMIPPGPNNPVGAAWIGLSKPGYGIHGTPEPEAVGRTESHGCFRLANWNAEYLARIVEPGTSVIVRP